jgi:hypothetical protein
VSPALSVIAFHVGHVANLSAIGHADGLTTTIGEIYALASINEAVYFTAVMFKEILNRISLVVERRLDCYWLLSKTTRSKHKHGEHCYGKFHGKIVLIKKFALKICWSREGNNWASSN